MSSEAAASSMMRGSFVDAPVEGSENSDSSESTIPVFARRSVQFTAAAAAADVSESPPQPAHDPLLIEGNGDEEIGERDKQNKQTAMLGRVDSFEDLEVGLFARQEQSSPVQRKGNQRVSMVRDLSTGQLGVGRAQCAQVGVLLLLLIYLLPSRQLILFSYNCPFSLSQLRSKSSRNARSASARDCQKFLQFVRLRRGGEDDAKSDGGRIAKHGRYTVSSSNLGRSMAFRQSKNADRQYRLQAVAVCSRRC
jgi:hypothetical protein